MPELNTKSIVKRYRIFWLMFGRDGKISYAGAFLSVLLFLVFPLINLAGAYLDGTLYLPGTGKGLMQHYGVWAGFITSPIIFILVYLVLYKYVSLLNNIDRYVKSKEDLVKIERKIEQHVNSLALKGNSKYILFLMVLVGLMFLIVNINQTIHPLSVYGNDVYDSFQHKFGFFAGKVLLFFLWAVFYPITFFIVVHIYFSMILIVKKMYALKVFYVDVFNKDGCGGASEFGNIILLINCVYFSVFTIMIALKFTHNNNYFVLNFFLIGLSVFFVVHNTLGIYYLSKILKENRNEILSMINNRLRSELNKTGLVPDGLMDLRAFLLAMRTNPYSKTTARAIKFIQFVPSVVGIVGHLLPFVKNYP